METSLSVKEAFDKLGKDLKPDLFSNVNFCTSGDISPHLLKLLESGGARHKLYAASQVTHFFAGKNADESRVEEARDIFDIPIIAPRWILYSIVLGQQQPFHGFTLFPTPPLFSTLHFSSSGLYGSDLSALWAMITYHGGTYSKSITPSTTHLLINSTHGVKFREGTKRGLKIVSADWVGECIKNKRVLEAKEFHPSLLLLDLEGEMATLSVGNEGRVEKGAPPESKVVKKIPLPIPISHIKLENMARPPNNIRPPHLVQHKKELLLPPPPPPAQLDIKPIVVQSESQPIGTTPNNITPPQNTTMRTFVNSPPPPPQPLVQNQPMRSFQNSTTPPPPQPLVQNQPMRSFQNSTTPPSPQPLVQNQPMRSFQNSTTPPSPQPLVQSQPIRSFQNSTTPPPPPPLNQPMRVSQIPTPSQPPVSNQLLSGGQNSQPQNQALGGGQTLQPLSQSMGGGQNSQPQIQPMSGGLNSQPQIQPMSGGLNSHPQIQPMGGGLNSQPQIQPMGGGQNSQPQNQPMSGGQNSQPQNQAMGGGQNSQHLNHPMSSQQNAQLMQNMAQNQPMSVGQSLGLQNQPMRSQQNQHNMPQGQLMSMGQNAQLQNQQMNIVQNSQLQNQPMGMGQNSQLQNQTMGIGQNSQLQNQPMSGVHFAQSQNAHFQAQLNKIEQNSVSSAQQHQGNMSYFQNNNPQNQTLSIQHSANSPQSNFSNMSSMQQNMAQNQSMQNFAPNQPMTNFQNSAQNQQLTMQKTLAHNQQMSITQNLTNFQNLGVNQQMSLQQNMLHSQQMQQNAQMSMQQNLGQTQGMHSNSQSSSLLAQNSHNQPISSQQNYSVIQNMTQNQPNALNSPTMQNMTQNTPMSNTQNNQPMGNQQNFQMSQYGSNRTVNNLNESPIAQPNLNSTIGGSLNPVPNNSVSNSNFNSSQNSGQSSSSSTAQNSAPSGSSSGNVQPQNSQMAQPAQVNPKTKTALANLLTNRLMGGVPGAPEVQVKYVAPVPHPALDPVTRAIRSSVTPPVRKTPPTPNYYHVLVERRYLSELRQSGRLGRENPNNSTTVMHQSSVLSNYGPTQTYFPLNRYLTHEPTHPPRITKQNYFLGCIFWVAQSIPEMSSGKWERNVLRHGGEIETSNSARVTHVICIDQQFPEFETVLREKKRVVTLFWLNECYSRGELMVPNKALHLPFAHSRFNKPYHYDRVSLSGYRLKEKEEIRQMCFFLGLKVTESFSRFNIALISRTSYGSKYEAARDWRLAVISTQYLHEMYFGMNVMGLLHSPRYQQFTNVAPLQLDQTLVPNLLLGWRAPIKYSPESADSFKVPPPPPPLKLNDGSTPPPSKRRKLSLSPLPQLHNETNETIEGDEEILGSPVVVTATGFSQGMVYLIQEKVEELGGSFSKDLSPSTTVLIVKEGVATKKLFLFLLNSSNIVSINWLKECVGASKFLNLAKYRLQSLELEDVVHGLRPLLDAPPPKDLFKGLNFFYSPSVRSETREIIESYGGVLLKIKSLSSTLDQLVRDMYRYIVLTCTEDEYLFYDWIKNKENAKINFVTDKIIHKWIINYEIDFEDRCKGNSHMFFV